MRILMVAAAIACTTLAAFLAWFGGNSQHDFRYGTRTYSLPLAQRERLREWVGALFRAEQVRWEV